MKRQCPEITWSNIAPPYYEYDYFAGGRKYPFHPLSEEFDLVNAWWLCEAAMLAYADADFATAQFQRADFSEVIFLDGRSTQCFVASTASHIFVVFRGTESRRRPGTRDIRHILADIQADCDILLIDEPGGGKVHRGFSSALNEVWDDLLMTLSRLHQPPRTVWITGHSLGAALATLAAHRYARGKGLYTFGSPRIGDRDFARAFRVKGMRIVLNSDLVAQLPPPAVYQHVGDLWFLNSHGILRHEVNIRERWAESLRGEAQNIALSLDQAWHHGAGRFIPRWLQDHIPLLYAIHLWNNLVDSSGTYPGQDLTG